MRAHLLNWTVGPAFLAALFASFGCEPQPGPPSLGEWLALLGAFGRLAAFFFAAALVLAVLMAIVQRLIDGHFIWSDVRLFATAMAVKVVMMMVVLAAACSILLLAATALGGWQPGWRAAAVGAAVGAVVGLPAGLGVLWLRIPQRLGLRELAVLPSSADPRRLEQGAGRPDGGARSEGR